VSGTIVVGYDEREVSRDALALARLLADMTGARLVVAAVFPYDERHMGLDAYRHALAEDRQRVLAPLLDQLGGPEKAEAQALGGHSAPHALHQLVEDSEADMVVIGSSERAELGRILAGTTAERLLHGSPCPVAVAPRGYRDSEPGLRVIAVGFDGSSQAQAALRLAADLAIRAAATIRIIAVLPKVGAARPEATQARTAWRAELRDQVHDEAAALPGELRALPIAGEGDPASVLMEHAEQGVDLLVTGSRAYGPVRRVLLGSVSSALMRAAPCPVLVVPRVESANTGDRS
jgi:nucleotide-binding universal stress UspA family protein